MIPDLNLLNEQTAVWIGEYVSILRAARKEGWLGPLLAAHFAPCDQAGAERLLDTCGLGQLKRRWTNRRGRANFDPLRGYSISLPQAMGTGFAHLRAGLVLHEAAHVLDRRQVGKFSHGESFRRVLRRLVESNWRTYVRQSSQLEIYRRHPGSCALLVAHAKPGKGGRVEETTEHMPGPYTAPEAHALAIALINGDSNVTTVHVFSIREGQFNGAFYKRGVEYMSWAEMIIQEPANEEPAHDRGVELCTEQSEEPTGETALLQPGRRPDGDEPVRQVEDLRHASPSRDAVPARRPVRDVPPQEQAAAGSQRKRCTRLELDPGNAERWPNSKGASVVRAALEAGLTGTASEIAAAVAADLATAGVEFPASLISRLKQGGFLREAA